MAASHPAPKSTHGRIYGVSIASILESMIFIGLYGWLVREFTDLLSESDPLDWSRSHILISSRNLAVVMIVSCGMRILFALALLLKNFYTCIIFYIVTQIGVIFNIITGFLGTYALITNGISWLTICAVGLHVMYVVLIHGVIKTMRAEIDVNRGSSGLPTHAVYGNPTTAPGLNASYGINYRQGPCPPYNANANIGLSDPPSYAQTLPSYTAEFGNGQQVQTKEMSIKH